MNAPSPVSLTAQLRTGTRTLHAEVERAGIMHALLRGQLPLPGYVALLHNLHALYAALEAALQRHADDPRLGGVCPTEVFRREAIESDLADLDLTGDGSATHLTPAMHSYVARLDALNRNAAVELLAHVYVRYLGDLNGGQVLMRIVERMLAGTGRRGVAFYDFGDPKANAERASALRQALDRLPLSASETESLVAEAQWAFRQHAKLFEELADSAALIHRSPGA